MKKLVKKKSRKSTHTNTPTPKNKYSSTSPEFDQWLNQMLKEDEELIKELAKR
jgi:hypothetical protein